MLQELTDWEKKQQNREALLVGEYVQVFTSLVLC